MDGAASNGTENEALRAENASLRAALTAAGRQPGKYRTDADRGRAPECGENTELDGGSLVQLNQDLLRSSSALASSEARLRAIFESSTDFAIIVTDLHGVITDWNEGAHRILGWNQAEVLGRSADLFFTPEDRARGQSAKEIASALERGRGLDERWHLRRDGAQFWASGLMMPLRVEGRVEGFLKILRDRTPEQEAKARHQRSEDRLHLALGAAGMIGVWEWDMDADLVYADANFAGIYGVDPQRAAQGAPIAEFTTAFHPDDVPAYQEALERTLTHGAPFVAEYRIRQPDGSMRWVLARGAAVRDAEGRPVRLPGAAVDITDRKLAEARQAALLEAGDRFRDLQDAGEMAFVAAEIMGRTLGLTRAGYGTVDAAGEVVTIERDWTAPGV